jgi:hypothetical protein
MQVMVALRYDLFIKELTSLIESGEVPMSRIDDAVERILRVKFVAGLFEFPFSDRSLLDIVGCKVSENSARFYYFCVPWLIVCIYCDLMSIFIEITLKITKN